MRDYEKQLNTFFEPETRERTEEYFEKYWLSESEYKEKWFPVQTSIFNDQAKYLPDKIFNDDLELIYRSGGNIFVPNDDFMTLNNCMKQAGDEYFVVIQNINVIVEIYDAGKGWVVHPFLRFKFPADISWEEMMSGGYASMELFQGASKDYFLYGDSGVWGKYVANSWAHPSNTVAGTPLNIIGYKKTSAEIFKKNFPSETESEYVLKWLPESYKV